MGVVVVSSEAAVDMEVVREEKERAKKSAKEGCSSVVRWERFLPRMALRVLLVEADDSTRQIISALLRKCSYRVAAVSDGLKAWEVLKGGRHHIDLILTEVNLPSISGFALLTLIMEHELCKNIPVIMMSSHDSISTVYKCMFRGATDFLVKPIRINELKNLWQHVWRRLSSTAGALGLQDESVAEQKVEATAENNAASNHSIGSKAGEHGREECVKKGSDAQSSCTKPGLEAESANMEKANDLRQPKQSKTLVCSMKILDQDNYVNSGRKSTHETFIADSHPREGAVERHSHGEVANCCTEACDITDVIVDSSREAINLIGTFDNNSRYGFGTSVFDNEPRKFESPQLDLSLRRFQLSGPENNSNKRILNHSNASAFSRYVNKMREPTRPTAVYVCLPNEGNMNVSEDLSDKANDSNSDAKEAKLSNNGSTVSPPIPHTDQAEPTSLCPNESPKVSANKAVGRQEQKLESLEDLTHSSSATNQIGMSSFCGGGLNHLSRMGSICGSNGNVNSGAAPRAASDSGNEGGLVAHDGNSQRSVQREAALTKFRLKRKERCYEKKVRYESRKKLAEQRPRVKGQFVRQVPPDPPPAKSENSCGNPVSFNPSNQVVTIWARRRGRKGLVAWEQQWEREECLGLFVLWPPEGCGTAI
ncbi:hypothetical protein Nepgr_010665 [Nepenthes gracilis]|uniref:Uncharacterized protein n=1 Tax=Nepenthes gracilis TaxID=150966 RepID=A0AAD3SCR7_NEPGR|nr:hypothetical protein Nepgr_010665 [Nepenthes gracilis]